MFTHGQTSELEESEEIIFGLEDEWQNDSQWLRDESSYLYDGFQNDIRHDLPSNNDWQNETWGERVDDYSYFEELLPYAIFVIIFQWMNIYENVFENHLWAYGNFFLLANTAISLFQGFTSFMLYAEFPTYMKHMKIIRALAFGIAIIWNIIYFWAFFEFYWDAYMSHKDWRHYG